MNVIQALLICAILSLLFFWLPLCYLVARWLS